MSLPVPALDDIEFEALLELTRGLIPRYASEWTDHNLHDPGITVLELLAWITDQQIYQLGFVGDGHIRAFAKLLGVRPKAAQPAHGIVWPSAPILLEQALAAGSRVTAVEQPEIPFILDFDRLCRLSAAQRTSLAAVADGSRVALASTDMTPRASFPATDLGGTATGAIELEFDRPLVSLDLGRSGAVVVLGIEIEDHRLGDAAWTAAELPAWGPLLFEYRVGTVPWQPVRIVEDRTISLLRTGVVCLEVPASRTAASSALRLRLDRGFFPTAPRIVQIRLNALPIVQLETRPAQIIGEGTGLPDQTLPLALAGLLERKETPRDLVIEVAEGEGWQVWRETGQLARSAPDETVIGVDRLAGTVSFGNGVNGRVPPRAAQIRHRDYDTTLGSAGNLRAGLRWRVAGVGVSGEAFGFNAEPLAGGEDAWDIERLSLEARRAARRRVAPLQEEDIRELVRGLPGFGVARAEVLDRFHPSLPWLDLPGHRTVAVIPEVTRDGPLEPAKRERYLRALRVELDKAHLLGERMTVTLAEPVTVRVHASLLLEPETDAAVVATLAQEVLGERLTDLPPRDANGPGLAPWPLGRPVTCGEVEGLLAAIDGVRAVESCALARGEQSPVVDDLHLGPLEVARGGQHVINLRRAGELR